MQQINRPMTAGDGAHQHVYRRLRASGFRYDGISVENRCDIEHAHTEHPVLAHEENRPGGGS